jgi:hypothetical protein
LSEGQRVAPHHPDDTGQAVGDKGHGQGVEQVLVARHAAVKQASPAGVIIMTRAVETIIHAVSPVFSVSSAHAGAAINPSSRVSQIDFNFM